MTDNNIETQEQKTSTAKTCADGAKTSAPAWISLVLAILAWVALLWSNGYVALGIAIASAFCGFAATPHRTPNIKRLAITAVIASTVLIVVVAAYLVVLKIGLG